MPTCEFIIALFCRVDDALKGQPKHPKAKLWPSELVTIGALRALKGGSFRNFYRWLTRNHANLFPNLPDRTRLLRLLYTYRELANTFLVPLKKKRQTGVMDSFGIEMLHPKRDGRSESQYARKGLSNGRVHIHVNGIIGAKFCPLLDAKGNIVDWDFDTANVPCKTTFYRDSTFHHLAERNPSVQVRAREIAFRWDGNFHKSNKRGGDTFTQRVDPSNLTICQRGESNQRMIIETVFSLWTNVLHLKKTTTRKEQHLEALLAFAVAAYNIVINWTGKTKLGMTFFSL